MRYGVVALWMVTLGLLLAGSALTAQEKFKAMVLDASSANYIKVQDTAGVERWVRLGGVVCDEPETPYGKAAKQELLGITQNKTAMLVLGGVDANGIRMADIYHKGKYLNAVLLRKGYCQLDPEAPLNRRLERAQKIAKFREKGIWEKAQAAESAVDATAASSEARGFDNQSFLYTIGGMGFLAIMIVVSRRRAATLKQQKREQELAEKIRQKNEETGQNVLPVDLTSNVLVSPILSTPPQPPGAPPEVAQQPVPPIDTSDTGVITDPLVAKLSKEDQRILESLDEREREKVLAVLREQYSEG